MCTSVQLSGPKLVALLWLQTRLRMCLKESSSYQMLHAGKRLDDALSLITEIPVRFKHNFSRLGVKGITEREFQFLKKYCAVWRPLDGALDILQGEDDCYYGPLLPTFGDSHVKVACFEGWPFPVDSWHAWCYCTGKHILNNTMNRPYPLHNSLQCSL